MVVRLIVPLATCGLAFACAGSGGKPAAVRLVDVFDARRVEGSAPTPASTLLRTEWRFTGATHGWEAGPGVAGLAVRDGLLVGRTTGDFPILHVERTTGLDNADQLHAVEVRLRASKGSNLSLASRPGATLNLGTELAQARSLPWIMTSPIVAGDQMQTYTVMPPSPLSASRMRHLLIRPTDAAGAEFAVESVRLVFRREHLAGVPSGVSWQGLRDVFRETLVTRSPETVRFEVVVPARPVMHVALGTPEDEPVTFRIAVRRGDQDVPVLTRTLTTPYRWEPSVVDLADFAGQRVSLSLSATSEKPGTIAFWGAPAIRPRVGGAGGGPPQTVILVQLDTLRTDHLDAYGYGRKTAPTLARLGREGALFRHAITQTSWTKAATPSVHTSLYPSTHGVHQFAARLPASAATIAEAYRDAGYATTSFSSVLFTGQFTNLHQGFEELHESDSTAGRAGPRGSKTSREYVDRLVDWLEDHRDVPAFVYLHFFDPHSPYEPNPPYDTMWADPKGREEYLRQQEVLKRFIKSAFLAQRGMATREELRAAGLDPEAFIRYSKDWYDGSIRGMDTEIGRLVERLEGLGLRESSLIAFYSDHGEEFHDHGRMWHGHSVYGEMVRVPLILWGPGHVPGGLEIEEPVQLIDVMPTLLEVSGLPVPKEAQGQSLRPLLAAGDGHGVAAANGGWQRRPVIAEKQPMGGTEFPGASETYAIVEGGWKLIHNVVRGPEQAEFELYDFYKDPRDQTDLSAQNPEVVGRLGRMLEGWRRTAKQARLKSDTEATKDLSAEQLERLRSLGYVR
ncbi:MAG TPA: sulfatase [Vicinamibacteria bacterium]|nr:sulfatase [Vicinamibacteria bacterium]